MDIYVVQPGDTIQSIADMHGVTVTRLIQDNELENPYSLVPGQSIVIVYPKQTHIVSEGDSLIGIANSYGITLMQLYRNNPYLSVRQYIYPGETLVISYNTIGKITTNGFAYSFINNETLRRTLPFLTYLTIFNYRVTEQGEIVTYSDDTEIIQIAKDYGVAPLMMLTTLTEQGESNIVVEYNILLNEEYQNRNIDNLLSIIKAKGYMGVNIIFNYLNTTNHKLYLNLLTNISNRLGAEGYLIYVTVNPNIKNVDNEIIFEKVDYSGFGQVVNGIIFLQFNWGYNTNPPSPVSSIYNLRTFIDYVTTMVSPDKITLGKPTISYDWELPYVPGKTRAISITLNATLSLANDVGATIQFDETSQTPYFYYYDYIYGTPILHIVWSIDARSINALIKLVSEYGLIGTGVWNIMIYYQQLWLIINSQFEIEKVLPEK